MNLIELIVITIGISLDIFARVECEGAQLAKINKVKMLQVCLAAVCCQAAALYLGHLGAVWLNYYDVQENLSLTARMLAAAIFLTLGIRMLVKAWKNEVIQEHLSRNGMRWKEFMRLICLAAAYTVLTGVALGLLKTNIITMLILIACITITAIVLGVYTGYHFGYEQKTKAYAIGGILLILGGMDVIVRYVIF